jgi:hypothetical protein
MPPHRKASLFQLNKGLIALYSMLWGGDKYVLVLGVKSVAVEGS